MTRRVDDHITRTRGAIDTLEAAKEAGDNAKTDFIVKEALQGANGTNGTNGTKYPNGTNDPNGGGSGGNGGSGGAAKTRTTRTGATMAGKLLNRAEASACKWDLSARITRTG